MSSIPIWKKVYQTVSGYSQNVTTTIVEEILQVSQDDLIVGLAVYKPYTRKSYEDWAPTSNASDYMKEFTHDLSQDLNLDTSVAYTVMCNFLMFEYIGKIKEFWQMTRIGTTTNLRESMWNFFTAERMFFLKTWRHIFESMDEEFEFSEQYKSFVKRFEIEELQGSLIKQFEQLLSEFTTKEIDERNPYAHDWLNRNIREQEEIVMILTLTMNTRPLTATNVGKLIKLFIRNNFSTTTPLYELRQFTERRDMDELMFVEIGCFLTILNFLWDEELKPFWEKPEIKELDDYILVLDANSGLTLIVLSWLLLKFKSFPTKAITTEIVDLVNSQSLSVLSDLVSCDMFKNCTVGEMILKSSHRVLDELCLMYEDRKFLYEQGIAVSVLTELLKVPDIAKICVQTRNGLDQIFELSLETFPFEFFSFTQLAQSLLENRSQHKEVLEWLHNLPSFLTQLDWPMQDRVSVLRRSQRALPGSDLIVFPPGTVMKAFGIYKKYLVQYRGSYSYFHYLEYLVDKLIENASVTKKFDEGLLDKIVAAYGVVIQAVSNCVNTDLKEAGLDRIVYILHKPLVQIEVPLMNFDLVRLYFQLQNAVITSQELNFFDICPVSAWKLFFPVLRINSTDLSKLLFTQYIFDDTFFMSLFHGEGLADDHSVALTYVNLLHSIMQINFQFEDQQLAAVTYILNFMFVQCHTWFFKDDHQRTQFILALINLFHFILQKDVDELNESEKKVFLLCQHAFLNNTFIVEAFLNLFVKDKYELLFLMERESNWVNGPALDCLKCIRMELALLLLLMNHKKTYGDCVLDKKLYQVVKPIAHYFTNSYSPIITKLSCRFLEKLAQDKTVPLLALLELDHYQIQSLFLERLRDPLEEEPLKVTIIDLINTCVTNQDGMTAAFFNLKCFIYWDGTKGSDVYTGDSISEFMVDYLQNIKKSHEYFKNPLQLSILRLLYNLWLNHRENLIENVTSLVDFWPVMVDPFFFDHVQQVDIYITILKIINLELGADLEGIDSRLLDTLQRLLADKVKLKKWTDFVLTTSKNNPKDLQLLIVWSELLVLIKRVMTDRLSDDVKFQLIESGMDGFTTPEGCPESIEIVYAYSRLYFILTTRWHIPQKFAKDVCVKLNGFALCVNVYYRHLSPEIKELFLCVLNQGIIDLREYFDGHLDDLQPFLNSIAALVDEESTYLSKWIKESDTEQVTRLRPWLVIISMAISLLSLKTVDEIAVWFANRKLLQNVIDSVSCMLQEHRAVLPFVKLAMDFLIRFADSPLGNDLLNVDFFDFYFDLRPPSLIISSGIAFYKGVPRDLKEWWLIFVTIIKLNRIMLQKHGFRVFNDCFKFVQDRADLMKEIISLAKYTVDMTALTLVCEALKFVYAILCLKPHWCLQHEASYDPILEGIKDAVNACVFSILGYKKINFFKVLEKDVTLVAESSPDVLVSVLNKIAEILYWATTCLRQSKPDPILNLHNPHCLEFCTLVIDHDFNVPRLEFPDIPSLKYGSILALADFMCKILNQLSPDTPSASLRNREVSLTNLHEHIKMKDLGKILAYCTATYEDCMGFQFYTPRPSELPTDKLSSLLHLDLATESSTVSVLSQLDYNVFKHSLDSLMCFMAYEIFYSMRNLEGEIFFTYKREISSEIQVFYEHVRKKTSEQLSAMVATPRSATPSLPQSESDIVKRYLMTKVTKEDMKDLADNHFLVVITQWMMRFCQLAN